MHQVPSEMQDFLIFDGSHSSYMYYVSASSNKKYNEKICSKYQLFKTKKSFLMLNIF